MELRQLRAFVEVATLGHFGHAAERLHLTQPALTQRIQALERELGLQLLERNAREVRLAPPGIVCDGVGGARKRMKSLNFSIALVAPTGSAA